MIILQARQGEVDENLSRDMTVRLMSFLGLAWVLGVVSFGAVIVNNSTECRISRQYLTQVLYYNDLQILYFYYCEI